MQQHWLTFLLDAAVSSITRSGQVLMAISISTTDDTYSKSKFKQLTDLCVRDMDIAGGHDKGSTREPVGTQQ